MPPNKTWLAQSVFASAIPGLACVSGAYGGDTLSDFGRPSQLGNKKYTTPIPGEMGVVRFVGGFEIGTAGLRGLEGGWRALALSITRERGSEVRELRQ